MAKTLTQHIAATRQFSNTENDAGFVTDAEITSRINEGVSELYDLVVGAFEHYYVTALSFTLAGGVGANTYALPADFYKDVGLDRDPSTTYTSRVPRLPSIIERNRPTSLNYSITGVTLAVLPPANAKGNYQLLYTPKAPSLTAGSDTLDTILSNWEEYVDVRAAIKVLKKREMDTAPLEMDLSALRTRILGMAANRSEEPMQAGLADTQRPWWSSGEPSQ